MTDLQKQFQEEKDVSFDGIPINGAHLEYIIWLEAQIQALRIHDVVGLNEQFKCHSCGTNNSGKNDDQLFEVCNECFNDI